jgi:STE24 endopeptidase
MEWNWIAWSLVFVYIANYVFVVWMEYINSSHRKKYSSEIPAGFEDVISSEKLALINEYSLENSRFFIFSKTFSDLIVLICVVFGVFAYIDNVVSGWTGNFLLRGILFFTILGFLSLLIGLPFDYYSTFEIEQKYGFNRSDLKTWVTDIIKSAAVSLVLMVLLLTPLLWSISMFPNWWWLFAFVILAAIQLTLVILYPVLIAPIFNEFKPLSDRQLAIEVEDLVKKTGMRSGGVFEMDAGKRSAHSNAYFTGIGRTKRIVLFDTLLDNHSREEIIGVLAHELGHFKLNHIKKNFAAALLGMFFGLFVVAFLIDKPQLYGTFGFDPNNMYTGLLILGLFWSKIAFFMNPLFKVYSRKYEKEADRFAFNLTGTSGPLISALKKLAGHNLSNLRPHPFYVWFYYSHPPLFDRVEELKLYRGNQQ